MTTVENKVYDKIKTFYFFYWIGAKKKKERYACGFVVSSMKFLICTSYKKY